MVMEFSDNVTKLSSSVDVCDYSIFK